MKKILIIILIYSFTLFNTNNINHELNVILNSNDESNASNLISNKNNQIFELPNGLGAGINMIDAKKIDGPHIKLRNPILDENKLTSNIAKEFYMGTGNATTIDDESINTFAESFSDKLSFNLSTDVSNFFVAFSSSFKSEFTLSSSSSRKQTNHFYKFAHEHVNYINYLVGSQNTLANYLSDEFKVDLINTAVTPATFFNRYGTHMLQSVNMGGKFEINNNVSTESYSGEFNTSAKIAAAVSGKISGGLNGGIDAEADASYNRLKSEYSSLMINVSSQIGGLAVPLNIDSLSTSYPQWVNSVNTNPTVTGVPDTDALIPIWNFLDNSPDQIDRKIEFKKYFNDKAFENYKSFLGDFGKTYVDIESIEITNNNLNVELGQATKINTKVTPTDSTIADVNFQLSDETLGTIDKNGNLKIHDKSENIGKLFNITASAGLNQYNEEIKTTKIFTIGIDVELALNSEVLKLGYNHSGMIKDNKALVWGHNGSGQLGNGTTKDSSTPIKINLPHDETPKQLSLGYYTTGIITQNNKIYVMGDNFFGSLGVGDRNNRLLPTEVILPNNELPKQIIMGFDISSIITQSGKLYSCGLNNNGQLGMGDYFTRDTFEEMYFPSNEKIKSYSLYRSHAGLITQSNKLFMWGDNSSGQLGTGDRDDRLIPTQIILSNNELPDKISLSYAHTAIKTQNNKLYTMGDNRNGQLGLGNNNNYITPMLVTIPNNELVKKISSGRYGSGIITENNNVYMTGDNLKGKFGLGDELDRNKFTKVSIPFNEIPIQLNLGFYDYSAILTETNTIYMSGSNAYGQFGMVSSSTNLFVRVIL